MYKLNLPLLKTTSHGWTEKPKDFEKKEEITKGLFILARSTGLARFPRSHLTSKSFVKTLMCSYERAGWLGYRDLGFSNRDLGKRAGNFAI